MSQFDRNPITVNELMYWKRNKLVNPRSKRKIKEYGRLYNLISETYKNYFPKDYDIFDSNDQKDPVSLKEFYSIDSSGIKKLEYENPSELILYRESETIIRCFEKETISYFNAYNISVHPISNQEIPEHVLNSIDKIEISNDLTPSEKALKVFQIFTNISIFIDYQLFLNLTKGKLLKLNYELKDFYYQNFSDDDRIKIDKKDGKEYFKLNETDLREKELSDIQIYILDQIENILSYPEEDLKFMINYIVLGGLSLFIKEVKEYYDNFNFSF